MISTFIPTSCHIYLIILTESLLVFLLGVNIHHPFLNKPAKPDSGPEFSVPAIGCPGTKSTFFGIYFFTELITSFFTDPTSVIIAPGLI